jgi:hypothetical protein
LPEVDLSAAMPTVDAAEVARFRECRRKWDFSSERRRNLEPVAACRFAGLERAVREALAVYYFPGMWDWPREVVKPLVMKAFVRALEEQRADDDVGAGSDEAWEHAAELGRRLLTGYMARAPSLDYFAPVMVEAEFWAAVPDPLHPGRGLLTVAGEGVNYCGRVDVLAVDRYDAYWILRHRLVKEWVPIGDLSADETEMLACWAWASFYLGMAIKGTIYNEVDLDAPRVNEASVPDQPRKGRVAQHEGSGGGRSIPQHRRLSARAREPSDASDIVVEEVPGIRRVWVRRHEAEVAAAASRLAQDLALIVDPSTDAAPNPSARLCGSCPYLLPCVEIEQGQNPPSSLASHFQPAVPEMSRSARFGSPTWSTGRGAAPPRFGGSGPLGGATV